MAKGKNKNENTVKSYRERYKRHFGISFGADMVVHHIDFDRTNNEVKNLLLLPRELHEKYHLIMNAIGATKGVADLTLNNYNMLEYNNTLFEQLPDVISECRKWQRLKEYRYSEVAYNLIFKR